MKNPTKEKVLRSFSRRTKINENLYKQIYGYELTYPGFEVLALNKLEHCGHKRIKEKYNSFIQHLNKESDKNIKNVASTWLRKQIDSKFEHDVKEYISYQKMLGKEVPL